VTRRNRVYLSSLILVLLTQRPAAAQNIEPSKAVLEEVTVTAQRREQNLQDTPVSVTAFTGEFLERSNINSARDYLNLTPNVSFTEDGQVGSRGVNIAIRGVSDVKSGENAVANAIGVYLDEFSVVSVAQGTINPQLQDVERIEVLRGPQGTYFGRNSAGGAMSIVTKKPVQAFESELKIGASKIQNAGSGQYITGVINVPVSDQLALRGVAHVETNSGLIKNVDPRGTPDSGYDYRSARISARWTPSDATTVDLMLMWSGEDEGIDPTVPSGVIDLDTNGIFSDPALVLPVDEAGLGFFPRNQHRVSHDRRERNDNTLRMANLRVTQQLGTGLVLKSITGVLDTWNVREFDNDLTSLDMLLRDNEFEGLSWSQELRLEATGSALEWVVGALYAEDSQDQYNRVYMGSERTLQGVQVLPPTGPFPANSPRATINQTDREYQTKSAALYADVTWHATDQWWLTLGGRYTHDVSSQKRFNVFGFGGARLADVGGEDSFDDFSPRFIVGYKPSADTNLYLSASKGYKYGGVMVGHISTQGNRPYVEPFKAENLWTYELGMKSEFWDHRLRVNGAVFHTNWKNMQLESTFLLDPSDISSNINAVTNVATATINGAELEVLAALTSDLTLSLGVGYLDTKMGNSFATIVGGNLVDLDGLPIPKSPQWTANVVANYSHPTSFGSAYLRGEWAYRGESYANIEALTYRQTGQPAFPYRQRAYDVLNLRTGLELGERVAVDLYVENVLGEDYYSGTQEDFGLAGIRLKPHPRVFGVTFSYRVK